MNYESFNQPKTTSYEIDSAVRALENLKARYMNLSDRGTALHTVYGVINNTNDLNALLKLKDLASSKLPRDLGDQINEFYTLEKIIDEKIKKITKLTVIETEEKTEPERGERRSA